MAHLLCVYLQNQPSYSSDNKFLSISKQWTGALMYFIMNQYLWVWQDKKALDNFCYKCMLPKVVFSDSRPLQCIKGKRKEKLQTWTSQLPGKCQGSMIIAIALTVKQWYSFRSKRNQSGRMGFTNLYSGGKT